WFATDISFHGLGTSFRLQGELTVTLPRLPIHFSGAPERPPMRPAALLGQNTEAILMDVAGLSRFELSELENLAIVATEPPI
ncbi:MAG: hypothetical protein CL434_14140, partial [Acidimicrobiaceae bacterium]|nr:hypothetical protein [Acidimicrobiaceae bacterium]